MTPYKSKSGKASGASAYEIGDDYIKVVFKGKTYNYTERQNSKKTIDLLKELAQQQLGLSTYISRNRNDLNHI